MATQTAAPPREQQQRRIQIEVRDKLLGTVEKYAPDLERLAPRGMDGPYFVASLKLYFAENPKLLECAPASIVQGMLRVAQTGLTIGVSCDLLPFKTRCQFSPRYTGIVELALASGTRAINKGVVREGDHFEYDKGTQLHLSHQKVALSTAPITHAYALAEIKQGSFAMEVLTREEIDVHRKRWSKSWWWVDPRNHSAGVIPLEDVPWYGYKTAIRQLAAVLPKNPRLAAALMFDKEAMEEEIPEGEYTIEGDRPGDEVKAGAERLQAPAAFVEGDTDEREPGEEGDYQNDNDLL